MTTENGCVYRLSVDLVNGDQIEVIEDCLSGSFSPLLFSLPLSLFISFFFFFFFFFEFLLISPFLLVQPSITLSEFNSLMEIVMKNTSAAEAILSRGGDLETTFCVPYTGSFFDLLFLFSSYYYYHLSFIFPLFHSIYLPHPSWIIWNSLRRCHSNGESHLLFSS